MFGGGHGEVVGGMGLWKGTWGGHEERGGGNGEGEGEISVVEGNKDGEHTVSQREF
jgi:hypothetical protein